MEIIGGVTAVPFGLLVCRIDGREIQITELGENGVVFRTAGSLADGNGNHEIEVSFYHMAQGRYETVRIGNEGKPPVITLEREEQWYQVYSVAVDQEDYRREVRELVLWYDRYIQLKCTCDDGELAGQLTGYPAELDEVYGESLAEQKEKWFAAATADVLADGREVMAAADGMELALELDSPRWYNCYLKEDLVELTRKYWEVGGLGECTLAKRLPDRLYIGNQFCPLLFPNDKQLFQILEKAERDKITVTVVFSYMPESNVKWIKDLLDRLNTWCKNAGKKLEIVVNDLGMVALVAELELKNLVLCMGTLLNRRRKDPRMAYKYGKKDLLKENSLNAEFYHQYVRNEWNIQRIEWESCGYEQNIGGKQDFGDGGAGGGSSLHLPYYQTNTSEYCTLYAICANGNRGKQNRVEHCPHYCETYAFLYPDHLRMVGKGNSLFALDLQVLINPEILKNCQKQGVNRLVIHLL